MKKSELKQMIKEELQMYKNETLNEGKITLPKLRGSTLPAAMAKLKKNLERSLFLREVLKDAQNRVKETGMKDNIKPLKSQIKDADLLTTMWLDAIKLALK